MSSDNPDVRAVAQTLIEAIEDGRPHDIARDVGLIKRGGVSIAEQRRLAYRDAALLRVRDIAFANRTQIAAAAEMIRSYEDYASRCWPRDRATGAVPQVEPAATWHLMLKNGIRMPTTAAYLAERLDVQPK